MMFFTQTIGNGAPICGFLYVKGGNTTCGWPPDNLQEFNKKSPLNYLEKEEIKKFGT
ncbi:MAG: hypothetical protein ACFFAN_06715 [Promethearchaeota archaeon]